MQSVKLDFEQARIKHLLFKSRLRAILHGIEIDNTPVLSHTACSVGQWLYGYALEKYGHLPEMQELEKTHFQIHESAKKLVELYRAGKVEAARHGLTEMELVADRVVILLGQLEKLEAGSPASSDGNYLLEIKPEELEEVLATNIELDNLIQQQLVTLQKLRASEEMYRILFETIDQGICVLQMIFDENQQPIDYRFLQVNPVFEIQTGLKAAEGKTARELVPDLEKTWFEIYGKVALTGESNRFIEGSVAMGRWFEVYAFRIGEPEARMIALLFKDISEQKNAEEKAAETQRRLQEVNEDLETKVLFRNMELEQLNNENKAIIADLRRQLNLNLEKEV